jgi:hypothetical protein
MTLMQAVISRLSSVFGGNTPNLLDLYSTEQEDAASFKYTLYR